MGGENSPKKIINGIINNQKQNKDVIYNIFGNKEKIEEIFQKITIKIHLKFFIHQTKF